MGSCHFQDGTSYFKSFIFTLVSGHFNTGSGPLEDFEMVLLLILLRTDAWMLALEKKKKAAARKLVTNKSL